MESNEASQSGVAPRDVAWLWLRGLLAVAGIVFLICGCWFLWRISMVAYQTEATIVAISADVKQMSTSGAQISEHLQKLDTRLRAIEEKVADAIKLDEVEHIFDEMSQLHDDKAGASGPMTPETEREIKHLLAKIRGSSYRFTYSDENKSGWRFSVQVYAKYKTYEKTLKSAEDFIDKVGTKTIAGQQYSVVIDADHTVLLNEWLADELKSYRAGMKQEDGQAVRN